MNDPAWVEHPEARVEFLDAVAHYLNVDGARLAGEFTDAVESAGELILMWPEAATPYPGRLGQPVVRTWAMGRFPYSIVYTQRGDQVFVLAYAHERRRPGYWEHRLSD